MWPCITRLDTSSHAVYEEIVSLEGKRRASIYTSDIGILPRESCNKTNRERKQTGEKKKKDKKKPLNPPQNQNKGWTAYGG